MFDYGSPQVIYFSQQEVVDIVQGVKKYHKGWCIFQGIYWSCELSEPSCSSIQAGEKALVIGRKGSTLIVKAFQEIIMNTSG